MNLTHNPHPNPQSKPVTTGFSHTPTHKATHWLFYRPTLFMKDKTPQTPSQSALPADVNSPVGHIDPQVFSCFSIIFAIPLTPSDSPFPKPSHKSPQRGVPTMQSCVNPTVSPKTQHAPTRALTGGGFLFLPSTTCIADRNLRHNPPRFRHHQAHFHAIPAPLARGTLRCCHQPHY